MLIRFDGDSLRRTACVRAFSRVLACVVLIITPGGLGRGGGVSQDTTIEATKVDALPAAICAKNTVGHWREVAAAAAAAAAVDDDTRHCWRSQSATHTTSVAEQYFWPRWLRNKTNREKNTHKLWSKQCERCVGGCPCDFTQIGLEREN